MRINGSGSSQNIQNLTKVDEIVSSQNIPNVINADETAKNIAACSKLNVTGRSDFRGWINVSHISRLWQYLWQYINQIGKNVSNKNISDVTNIAELFRNIIACSGSGKNSNFRDLINASHVSRQWQVIYLTEVAKRLGFQNFDEIAKRLGFESWQELNDLSINANFSIEAVKRLGFQNLNEVANRLGFESWQELNNLSSVFRSAEHVLWCIKHPIKQGESRNIKKTLPLLEVNPEEITLDHLREAGIVPEEETRMDDQALTWFKNKSHLLACIRHIPQQDVPHIPYILHWYLRSPQLDVCLALLKDNRVELKINERDRAGWGVLHYLIHALKSERDSAYLKKGLKILEVLVKNGLHIDASIDNETQGKALHLAAIYGNFEIVKGLLDAGATPYVTNKKLEIPLHLTVIVGNESFRTATILKIINYLCDKDKDGSMINARNKSGETALDQVKKENSNSPMAVLLRQRGARSSHAGSNSNMAIQTLSKITSFLA